MDSNDDRPVAGSMNESDGVAGALAPPERHSEFSKNRSMIAVMAIVVLCVTVMVIALTMG